MSGEREGRIQIRLERWVAGPVAAVSLLLLVVALSGAWHVRRLQTQSSAILTRSVAGMRAAAELELLLLQIRHHLDRFLWLENEENLRFILTLRENAEMWLSRADSNGALAAPDETIDRIRRGLNRFYAELQRLMRDDSTANRLNAAGALDAMLAEEVLIHANAYLTAHEADLENSRQRNEALSSRLIFWLLLLGVVGAGCGAVAGWGMARMINRSIYQLQLPIHAVAGKLNEVVGPISVSGDISLDELEEVLRRVSDEVSSVVEKLQVSHQQVLRADQLAALGQLAAGLAHELRNPLMCMKVVVQSAMTRGTHSLEGRDLGVLDEEIRRLEQLLAEFVDFARPGKLTRSRMDLCALAEATISFVTPRARRRGAEISLSIPSTPVVLWADSARIRQLLLNLLLNSLDAIGDQGRIHVDVRPVSHPRLGKAVELIVRDDGEGIRVEHQGKIFDPFFSTRETGLGLGLPICQRIVESHEGEIQVSAPAGGGTTFTVVLPLSAEDDGALPRFVETGAQSVTAGARG